MLVQENQDAPADVAEDRRVCPPQPMCPAGNCDELVLDALTGEGTGTFTFTTGTGRFADVSGQGTFDALIDLSFPTAQPMTVTLDGRISY